MHKLLFDSPPLVLNSDLACVVGLNEAIILQQVHYWIEINKQHKRNFRNGRYWTYNTLDQWQEQFPFWSMSTIKRTIANLKTKKPILITDNFNKMKLDRTVWYSIDYRCLYELIHDNRPLGQNDPMDKVNLTQPITRDYPKTSDGLKNKPPYEDLDLEPGDVFQINIPYPPDIYDRDQRRTEAFYDAIDRQAGR